MPRETTKGCSVCGFGRHPCVTPIACNNPHVFERDEDDMTVLIGRLLILLFALLLLIVWWRAA